LRSWG